MGIDVRCTATLGKQSAEGQAQLETDFLQFRSDALRFKVQLRDLTEVKAAGDFLDLRFDGKRARLHLGEKAAERWAGKILNPPTRLDKLGIKPGVTVCLEGAFEAEFLREVSRMTTSLSACDLVFLSATNVEDLAKASTVAKKLPPGTGLWIVYPKGRQDIREIDVIQAGRATGLKDVKVVRFSETHTALKFVAPAGNGR